MLSDVACRSARPAEKPYKLTDGGGLYLFITPAGGKLWRADYRHNGKRRTASFGSYPAVSLATARKAREDLKGQLSAQVDPAQVKRSERRARQALAANNFEKIAREWFAAKAQGWLPRYGQRVMDRLEADVFPPLGRLPITEIEPPDVLEALRKVEARGC